MKIDAISYEIIGVAYEVHKELGPGLLESAYRSCFATGLTEKGIRHRKEVSFPLRYHGKYTDKGYRVDFLVEDLIVVEIKAVRAVTLLDEAQLNTYLRLQNLPLGLLINFNVKWLKTGIHRVINPCR